MAGIDQVGLGLDDIIQIDKTSNRRGGGAGSNRGFRGQSGRGGGGIVSESIRQT